MKARFIFASLLIVGTAVFIRAIELCREQTATMTMSTHKDSEYINSITLEDAAQVLFDKIGLSENREN